MTTTELDAKAAQRTKAIDLLTRDMQAAYPDLNGESRKGAEMFIDALVAGKSLGENRVSGSRLPWGYYGLYAVNVFGPRYRESTSYGAVSGQLAGREAAADTRVAVEEYVGSAIRIERFAEQNTIIYG